MGRRRRLFGPLLGGVLTLASLVLVGLYLWGLWPTWRHHWELRSLAEEMRSPDPFVNWHAADQLARAGSVGVPRLVEATRDRDASVRFLAFSALGRTVLSKSAIPAFVEGLRDEDVRIRRQAADALARFGPEAVAAADALTKAMRDDDPDVRFRAARALSRIEGGASEPALRALLALVADPVVTHLPDRTVLVPVIRRMGPAAEARAVAALIPLIDVEDPLMRRTAIECLERIGPSARDATPALERALRDDDRVARCLATLALSEIEGWESGRARSLLQELADSPSLPPVMQEQVRWVVSADLVAGSEVSQPVHTLRALVAEFRLVEARTELEAVQSIEDEELLSVP